MDGIKSQSLVKQEVSGMSVIRRASVIDADSGTAALKGAGSAEITEISNLSQQLNAAAERAAARDGGKSRKELYEIAQQLLDKISGGSYRFSKEAYDRFIPDTKDEELLVRAAQATEFVNGKGPNPFAALTHEQLALITYDDSSDFTVNERRSAYLELADRYGRWSSYITQKMDVERQQTGRSDNGVREIIAYYKALPPIEEAQIHGNYEVEMLVQLSQHEIDWPEFRTLLEMIADPSRRPDPSAKEEDAESIAAAVSGADPNNPDPLAPAAKASPE